MDVLAASRSGSGPHGVALDRRNLDALVATVRERRVETVVDLLAMTEAHTLPLIAMLKDEVERWVMASSGDVYRNYEGLHRHAQPVPDRGPILETSPLRTTRYPYRASPRRSPEASDGWMDDYDKIPLESGVRESFGPRGVILRLPMTYGPGDRQSRFGWIIAPMVAGKTSIPVDPAWAAWRMTYGYIDDVGDAIATSAVHPGAAGGAFNIGESEGPDHYGWIERYAKVLGWTGAVQLSPAAPGSRLSALDFSYPLLTDTMAFRAAFGWK